MRRFNKKPNSRHQKRQQTRGLREKVQNEINKTLFELNELGQQRLDLGNSFLEGADVTEEMVVQLNEGKYHDELFQSQWNEFQRIQNEMTRLKNKGADLVIQKKSLMPYFEKVRAKLEKFE